MKECFSKYRDLFLLFFLIIVALALRLYRITEQSIWHEEFVLVANARLCNLITNIQLLLINVSDYGISPGSTILYYFWINIFPEHIWVWRLLPILFGIFSISLLYYFGKSLFEEKIGFFAGLIMALSPIHVYIHQELKMYSFLLFFALFSWFCLYKYIFHNTNKKYWLILGGVVNILLPWFHAVYLYVPILQFIVIVIFWKRTFLIQKIYWLFPIFASVLLFGSWLIYLTPSLNNVSDYPKEKISLAFTGVTMFGNDCVNFANELLPEWKTNDLNIIHNKIWKFLFKNWLYFDIVLIFLIIFCFSIFIVYGLKKIKRKTSVIEEKIFFIILLVLLPPGSLLMLRLVSGLAFFLPLYFIYVLPFLYLIISYTIFKILPEIFRCPFCVFFVLLYVLQCLGIIMFTSRPDYKSAVSYIEENANEKDIILDLQLGTNYFDVWKVYKKRKDIKFNPVLTLQSIADITHDTFSKGNGSIWILMETSILTWFYNYDPTVILIKALKPLGMKITLKHFPGKFNLYVVRIEKENYNPDIYQPLQLQSVVNIDYDKLLNEVKCIISDDEQKKEYKKILRKYITIWPPIYTFHNIVILNRIISDGNLDFAGIYLNYLMKKYPSWDLLHDIYILLCFKMQKITQLEEKNAKEKIKNKFLIDYFRKDLKNYYLQGEKGEKDNVFLIDVKERGLCLIDSML